MCVCAIEKQIVEDLPCKFVLTHLRARSFILLALGRPCVLLPTLTGSIDYSLSVSIKNKASARNTRPQRSLGLPLYPLHYPRSHSATNHLHVKKTNEKVRGEGKDTDDAVNPCS